MRKVKIIIHAILSLYTIIGLIPIGLSIYSLFYLLTHSGLQFDDFNILIFCLCAYMLGIPYIETGYKHLISMNKLLTEENNSKK